jgi:hypothetical protein
VVGSRGIRRESRPPALFREVGDQAEMVKAFMIHTTQFSGRDSIVAILLYFLDVRLPGIIK